MDTPLVLEASQADLNEILEAATHGRITILTVNGEPRARVLPATTRLSPEEAQHLIEELRAIRSKAHSGPETPRDLINIGRC